MKKNFLKRVLALSAAAILAVGTLAGCGGDGGNGGGQDSPQQGGSQQGGTAQDDNSGDGGSADAKGGKILYLSNLTSGAQYDYFVAFYENACKDLGYDFEVVYGDGFNDPDGNLSAVRNAYTSDVVGLIACQDGGLGSIMQEYPDMYVCGFFSDMDAVFNEDGTSHEVLTNDHFLGNMGDNYITGEELGTAQAEEVIARGYKKVATIIFPIYAYPKHTAADAAFRAKIAEYNESASEPIEIVGDATVLEFQPLDGSYFLEDGHSDLDCIVAICAGTTFVYPSLVQAKADGSCDAKTQMITGGFENDPDLLADCGDDKTIVMNVIQAPESALFPIVMIDNAVQGKQFADYSGPERMSSGIIKMNSTAAFEAIVNNSPVWDADLSKMQRSWEDMKQYFTRYNESATYAGLVEATTTSLSIDGYLN